MTGLWLAELKRLASRRLARVLVLLAVAGFLIAGVATFFTSSSDPARLEQIRQDARAELERCQRLAPGGDDRFCPSEGELVAQMDTRFRYAQSVPDVTTGITVLLLLVAFVFGASFVGADWGAGTVTTQLTWETRRHRLLAAKLLAAVPTVAVVCVLLLMFLAVVLLPAGMWRGHMDGPPGWGTDLVGRWLRAGGLAAIGSTVGIGAATIARNTAGAIGAGFAYVVVADPLLAVWRQGRLAPWLLQRNIAHFLGVAADFGDRTPPPLARPAMLLTAYTLLLVLVAYAAFQARDVT